MTDTNHTQEDDFDRNQHEDFLEGVICLLDKLQLIDSKDSECEKHIHYSVAEQKVLVSNSVALAVQFPKKKPREIDSDSDNLPELISSSDSDSDN
jgi:hypothetical protein